MEVASGRGDILYTDNYVAIILSTCTCTCRYAMTKSVTDCNYNNSQFHGNVCYSCRRKGDSLSIVRRFHVRIIADISNRESEVYFSVSLIANQLIMVNDKL